MLCSICEVNETWTDDEGERDFCIMCWFKGRVFERALASEERSFLLERIRELPNVTSAEVWHFGQGMFTLNIMLKDGRLITPGAPASAVLGQQIVVPYIPAKDDEWAVTITRLTPNEEGEVSGGGPPTVLPDNVDDEGLVKLIQEIA